MSKNDDDQNLIAKQARIDDDFDDGNNAKNVKGDVSSVDED